MRRSDDRVLVLFARCLHREVLLGVSFPGIWVNYLVLLWAIAFETWAFKKANAGMKAEMRDHGWGSIVETARKTTNTVTLTAFTEDALASGGAVIALVGIWLSQNTGDPIYDAVASFIIGLLLMAFALMLSWQNKRLLLGESFPDDEETKLRTGLEESDRVVDVIDFRSVFFGPTNALVTADGEFQDGMSTGEIEAHITSMAKELKSINPDVKAVYIERPE